jgi:hypothetical protein
MATLADQVEVARANAGRRGFAVTFSGPAATAYTRGCVDGYHGRPSQTPEFSTTTERESYEYGYASYYREPRDRHGSRYETTLF